MGAGEFGCEVVGPVHLVGRDAGHAPPHQEVDNRRALGAGQADDVNVLPLRFWMTSWTLISRRPLSVRAAQQTRRLSTVVSPSASPSTQRVRSDDAAGSSGKSAGPRWL